LGITIPLLVSEFAVYAFSNVRLTEKVDEANERGLLTVQAVCDSILAETHNVAIRFDFNTDLQYLLTTKKELFPDYKYISLANDIIEELRLSMQDNLYENIAIYSSYNDFVFCSMNGGQQRQYYRDESLLPAYLDYTAKNPGKRKFYAVRQGLTKMSDIPDWTLTYYQTLSSSHSPYGNDFIAINIGIEKLIHHLQTNMQRVSSNILILDETRNILVDTKQEWIGENKHLILQDPDQGKTFLESRSGAMNIQIGGSKTRMNWVISPISGWGYVQMIPYEEYMLNTSLLKTFFVVTILIGLVVSTAVAFLVSYRLFRPIADIMHIMEDPHAYNRINDQSGEVKYLLMNILRSFQKNITLEEEMIKKVADLRNARAKALQEQMTPHFLYNTLQAVNWIALMETHSEDSKTSVAIVTLSEIIRTCMEQSDNMTTIEKELDYVKKFISLEQLRFGDTIRYHVDIDPNVMEKKIPRITVQPLVENAITHGIKPGQLDGTVQTGHIYIRIKGDAERILLCVEDNGVGMDPEEIRRFNEVYQEEYVYANQHVGLLNLSQRIQLIYGEEWKIALSSSRLGGLKVEIAIPMVESAIPLSKSSGTVEKDDKIV
jgi:two-component system sensor histidine kinase YesM